MYSAVDPSQLIEIEKTKMAELQRSLPELEAIFNASSRKPKVTYYEGMEGIKEVYGDMLKEKKPIFAYEDLEHMKASMPKSFYDYFPPERARRGDPAQVDIARFCRSARIREEQRPITARKQVPGRRRLQNGDQYLWR